MVDMFHGDVGNRDILHSALVHFLECETAAPHTCAIGNGNIAVSTIRLRAQFDAPTSPVYFFRHIGAIEQRPQFVTSDDAVGDSDMLGCDRFFQRIGAFEDNTIIERCIYFCVAHSDVFAAVDIDTVAVGVDGDIVDSKKVASGCNDGEMTSAEDGDISDKNIAAHFDGDSLVACTDASPLHISRFLRVLACESLAVDHPPSGNGNIMLSFGPDKRIMEISVATVLVFGESEDLALIISLHFGWSSHYNSPWHQVKIDIAFHVYAPAQEFPRGHNDLSTAIFHRLVYGTVYGCMVKCLPIAYGTEIHNII